MRTKRRTLPIEHSRPIVDDLKQYLEARNRQVSAKSKLGEAIRYALLRWDGLTLIIDDGRIDLDNNSVERAIRPLALNRRTLYLQDLTKAETTGLSSPPSLNAAASLAASTRTSG